MSVLRHLGPTAMRALLLVCAGSFVQAMFPHEALDQIRGIPADAAKQLSQEWLHQPHQTDSAASWLERPVEQDVEFGHVDFPLVSSPAQGYQSYYQPLHHGQAPQHRQLDAYNQQPYRPYSQGPYGGQVPQLHQSNAYNQQLNHQELAQYNLLHGEQYYGGAHQVPQSGYITPASSLHPLQGVEFGDAEFKLESSPVQDYPAYHQDLYGQVSQHQPFDYHSSLYGHNEAGQPSNELVQGSSLLHYPRGEAAQFYHPVQPQHYNLAYQPHHGQVYGAGPSHLPDQIQENDPSNVGPDSKRLQGSRMGMERVPQKESITDYDPVSMTNFLGFDTNNRPKKFEREELERLLRTQLQELTEKGILTEFQQEYVVKLSAMTKRRQDFYANQMQQKVVFNIIMQRMLAQGIHIDLIQETVVLKTMVGRIGRAKEWLRDVKGREWIRKMNNLDESSVDPLGESWSNPLNIQWKSDSGIATFDLNKYRIVIGRKQNKLGNHIAYQVGGVCLDAPQDPCFLFIGNFAAHKGSDSFIGSKSGRAKNTRMPGGHRPQASLEEAQQVEETADVNTSVKDEPAGPEKEGPRKTESVHGTE
ncbi:hypothetical protein ACQY0O_004155 [Thecaphora frezii]